MAESPNTLALVLLRLTRAKIAHLRTGLAERSQDVRSDGQGLNGMIMALAGYVRVIDHSARHLETKIGV